MRRVFIAEVTAFDPRKNKTEVLRMCSGGQGPVAFDDDHEYIPCIEFAPQQSLSFNEDGKPGELQRSYGNLGIRIGADLRNTHWRGYDFDGYPCKLMWGEYGAPLSSYKPIPAGRTGSLSSDAKNKTIIPIIGPDAELKKEVMRASYAGTGAAEGREDYKGQLKPFTVGLVENIEPPMIDPVYLVYQYHGYGPTQDVIAVYENALTLGPAKYTVNSYEQLIGLTAEQLPPGTWAKAPAVGMYRLGGEALGKLTADVIGATDNGQPLTSFGAIACWMLREFGGVPANMIDTDSAEALDRDFPHTWGNYLDSRDKPEDDSEPAISVGDFLREAASHLTAYMFADEHGVWRFGRNVPVKEPLMLQQGRTTWPVVTSISMPATSTRVHKVRVGGRRCFAIHNDNEISSALKDAIEEAVVGVGEAVQDVADDVDDIRKNFRSLVLPALQEPIADIQALQLEYGAAQLKAATALHKQNHVAIQAIGTRVDENGSLVAEQITQLTSRVEEGEETVEAGFLEVNRTIANEKLALTEQMTLMIANYGEEVSAAFTEERRVSSQEKEALAEDISAMEVRVGSAEGKISELERIVIDEDGGTAESIRELGIRIDDEISDREAAITAVEKVVVDKDSAMSLRVNTISNSINGPGGLNAIIQGMQKTETDNNGARAQEINALQTRLNSTNGASYEQNVQLISNINGLMSSQVTFKVGTIVNGVRVVGGLGIINQNGYVDTAFATDAFSIWTPGGKVPLLTLDGNALRVNNAIMQHAVIDGAQINRLSIGPNQIALNSVTVPHFVQRTSAMYGNGTFYDALSYRVNARYDCDIFIWVHASQGFPNGDRTWNGRLLIDGQQLDAAGGQKTADTFSMAGYARVGPGPHDVLIRWQGSSSVTLAGLKVMILEAIR